MNQVLKLHFDSNRKTCFTLFELKKTPMTLIEHYCLSDLGALMSVLMFGAK